MKMPEHVAAIKRCGHVNWAGEPLSETFRAKFNDSHIPVKGIRHVRLWGLQVDDEKAIPGHERSSIPDEELWEVQLLAKDGSTYEVNSTLVVPTTNEPNR